MQENEANQLVIIRNPTVTLLSRFGTLYVLTWFTTNLNWLEKEEPGDEWSETTLTWGAKPANGCCRPSTDSRPFIISSLEWEALHGLRWERGQTPALVTQYTLTVKHGPTIAAS